MKATELRIGNYYIGCSRQEIEVVSGKTIEQFESGVLPCMKPILLNEEWLLKFGFERHHADYANDIIYIKNVPDNTEFEWGVYPNELGSGIQIQNRNILKYVHQLQNLYFALTGEELEIKDKDE